MLSRVEQGEHHVRIPSVTPRVIDQPEFASKSIGQKRVGVHTFGKHPVVHACEYQYWPIVERQFQPTDHLDRSILHQRWDLYRVQLLMDPTQAFGEIDLCIEGRRNRCQSVEDFVDRPATAVDEIPIRLIAIHRGPPMQFDKNMPPRISPLAQSTFSVAKGF